MHSIQTNEWISWVTTKELILRNFPWFNNREYPRDVKAKLNIAFRPITRCFRDETLFVHGFAVGEMQLKYVTSGFDIETE
jgi:hypothetical protein